MACAPSFVAERDPATQWCRLGDEVVVLDGTGKRLCGFNATAARTWELLDAARSAREIALQVASEHEEPLERVLPDVLGFFDSLLERALIRPAPGGAR